MLRILMAAACLVVLSLNAEESTFYDNEERGWHWYEEPPEVVEEELEPQKTEPGGSGTSGPPPLSAEWLRVELPKLRDAAIDSPTRENVTNYFVAQRIMMDKAQVFSDQARRVVQSDPLLDENNRLPFASAAKISVMQAASETKKQILNEISKTVGVWFFFDETCSFCKQQVGPINKLAESSGLVVQVISKQGTRIPGLHSSIDVRKAQGQFESLGVKFTPAVMMVVPPDGYYLVSQGFLAYTALVDRLIAAANEHGLMEDEMYYAANPMQRGIVNAHLLGDKEIDWDNPDEWVQMIREEIAKTYQIDLTGEDYVEK